MRYVILFLLLTTPAYAGSIQFTFSGPPTILTTTVPPSRDKERIASAARQTNGWTVKRQQTPLKIQRYITWSQSLFIRKNLFTRLPMVQFSNFLKFDSIKAFRIKQDKLTRKYIFADEIYLLPIGAK